MQRSVTTDLMTGEQTARCFIDGGVFGPVGRVRLDDTGTEMTDISDRIYRIHPDDPLSAAASMEQEATFERGDWSVRVRTNARQTATATAFLLEATVSCWDGDELVFETSWQHEIQRNGM